MRFFGIQSGVNSAKDHECAAFPRYLADLISAERVRSVDPDPDGIARMNASSDRAGARVSSTRIGSPSDDGVAAASTYCQRGVITAVPNDTLLGLIK